MRRRDLALLAAGAITTIIAWRLRRRREAAQKQTRPPSSSAPADEVLNAAASNFAARACELLREQGFARVKMITADAALAHQMYCDANAFFDDSVAKRGSHVPPNERKAMDARTGYIREGGREYLEIHPRTAAAAAPCAGAATTEALRCSGTALANACHRVCEVVLAELAGTTTTHITGDARGALESLIRAEQNVAVTDGFGATDVPFGASMLRIHRYTEDADLPVHCDLGLLTFAPRASLAGLQVQVPATGAWIAIEEWMAADEAV